MNSYVINLGFARIGFGLVTNHIALSIGYSTEQRLFGIHLICFYIGIQGG